MTSSLDYDVVVIGAGAAGLLTASRVAQSGLKVVLLEKNKLIARKILISGGGRCNFTNTGATWENYLSSNPNFPKFSLGSYRPESFIDLVKSYRIPFEEKKLGQLFCSESSKSIIHMLTQECEKGGVEIRTSHQVDSIEKVEKGFLVSSESRGDITCKLLVMASGGLSIPTLGASDWGHRESKKFGHSLVETYPGLVPFTLDYNKRYRHFSDLSGTSTEVVIKVAKSKVSFRENILFTHKGLSGPAILQISSYWKSGLPLFVDFLPNFSEEDLRLSRGDNRPVKNMFKGHLPQKLLAVFSEEFPILKEPVKGVERKSVIKLLNKLKQYEIYPNGTEGYRKAEVTCGGVNTREVSPKTMESKKVPGLFFVGEILDVTGWLGGYNFQWAWASGYVASEAIKKAAISGP